MSLEPVNWTKFVSWAKLAFKNRTNLAKPNIEVEVNKFLFTLILFSNFYLY